MTDIEVLQEPFEIEVETKPAVISAGPMCAEAEYRTYQADEDVVRASINWLICKHFRELEDNIRERQLAKWRKDREEAN